MSVTWVFDGTNHEISSKEHLLQLMTQGTLYTDAGSPPADYWGSTTAYIQTVDIDLDFDSNIVPIGASSSDGFEGDYDGGKFTISNWAYSVADVNVGLFGYVKNALIQRIRLTGVWTMDDYGTTSGFFVGYSSGGNLYDIEADFDEGTYLNGTLGDSGCLIGSIIGGSIEGITLKGTITTETDTSGDRGGIVGASLACKMAFVRNLATFPNGITGGRCGGIVGNSTVDSEYRFLINSMTGNIQGARAGGLFGTMRPRNSTIDVLVNSMKGDILGTFSGGGIAAEYNAFQSDSVANRCMNYMSGNIEASGTTSTKFGGFFGGLFESGSRSITITNSVVAMNGSTTFAFNSDVSISGTLSVEMLIDDSFGFSYTTLDEGSTSQVLTGYSTETDIPDLLYVPIQGSFNNTEVYDWEFLFANVGGKAAYSSYTHIVVFTSDIVSPVYVDFDLSSTSTTYIGYYDDCNELHVSDASLTVNDSDAQVIYEIPGGTILFGFSTKFSVTVGSIYATVDWAASDVFYRVTYTDSLGNVTVLITGTQELTARIENLVPESVYTIELDSSTTGETYSLVSSQQITTTQNTAANFDTSIYADSNGTFDLSDFEPGTLATISEIMDDIFSTSDVVKVMDTSGDVYDSVFLNLGGTVTIGDADAVLIPFDASQGIGQQATVTLSDNTSTLIEFDETTGEVTVGGTTYTVGQSFILDGKRILVSE